MEILKQLKPMYSFSAHLHVKFEATVNHDNGTSTHFLALDKCIPHAPNRQFLQVIDLPEKKFGWRISIRYGMVGNYESEPCFSIVHKGASETSGLWSPGSVEFNQLDGVCEE